MSLSFEKFPQDLILPEAGRTKRIFLAGKGGVGKTTMSSAIAVYATEQGRRTLLITTDPAAHTGNVLGVEVTAKPIRFQQSNLWLARIDPKQAFWQYKERVLKQVQEQFGTGDTWERVNEELNSPCTEEVAVFQEFLDFLLDDSYEVVVFDTAPTGHTIRLLTLSFDYETELKNKDSFTAETAALDQAQMARMQQAIRTLQDPVKTSMMFVTLAETTPITEMERAMGDLAAAEIPTQAVIVNQVLPEEAQTSPLFGKRRNIQLQHYHALKQNHPQQAIAVAEYQEDEIIGAKALLECSHLLIRK
ncbi:ArsA family ATPase [Fodinisporobacter ferrooxydans]|uniref:ArsA family ATPase n=1 Tax=Fodinisporobacter ferrooxydans TaxID=2901836 RepID=A0ABY4CHN1_9BACL|nr:ArsA family ATPase [Alicyclobacillaceae bacterium MYW30-H2]